MGAVAGADLGEQMVDVALDGAFAHDEALGDLDVRQAAAAISDSTSASRASEPVREPGGRWPALRRAGVARASTRWCWTAGSIAA